MNTSTNSPLVTQCFLVLANTAHYTLASRMPEDSMTKYFHQGLLFDTILLSALCPVTSHIPKAHLQQ